MNHAAAGTLEAGPATLGLSGSGAGRLIQGLDPRARILAAVAFALVTVTLQTTAGLGAALLLALMALAAARLPLGRTLGRMIAMDSFIVVMLLMLPFTVPGAPVFTLFGMAASLEGLHQALRIALIANAVVLMLLALVGSLAPPVLGHALSRLGMPSGLVHLLVFTLRYVVVIQEEMRRMRRAMKTRCYRPRTDGHTLRTTGYMIGMLLIRALERSERVMKAMTCRGFTGRLVLLDSLRFRARDGVFLVLAAGMVAILPVLDAQPLTSLPLITAEVARWLP